MGLVRPKETQGDRELLGVQVSREADDFHAIPKRLRNPSERVRSGHEKDVGEVVLQLQIMVRECLVLFRVQNLQEGGAGIAMEIARQFVDLIEQEHGVGGPATAHSLEHPPG